MSSGTFSYDEAVADTAHGDIGSVKAGLEASLNELGGFVNKVKSAWEGDEMDEYAAVQQKFDSASDTVKGILHSVHTALGSTTGSVKEMRSQVKGAIQG